MFQDILAHLCGDNIKSVDVKWVLENIINETFDIVSGCSIIDRLRYDGYDFIPIIFTGYANELDRGGDVVELYKQPVISECIAFLKQLNEKIDT